MKFWRENSNLHFPSGTVNMEEEYEEEEYVYAERNVLQEEATTVEAETITVDKFRQRFCHNTMEKGPKIVENANVDSHPKYKAPPPPPRQRGSSSTSSTFKVRNFGAKIQFFVSWSDGLCNPRCYN